MMFNKKILPLLLSLSLVLPNFGHIYSYADEVVSLTKEKQKIKTENTQKEKIVSQLDGKFDLEDESGDYVAKQLNKYKSKENFEYAVKEVLNYYYDEEKPHEIKKFKKAIDSRADTLIENYEEAAHERDSDEDLGYKAGEVIVQFKDNVDKELKEEVVDNLDGEINQLNSGNIGVIDISNAETVDKALENYEENAFIESVQPNFAYSLTSSKKTTSTNDEYSNAQYYLKNLKIYDAWDYLSDYKTSKVKVAVLDTGLDVNHPDIKNSLYLGVDAENNYATLKKDKGYHGTHVSGILAATTNNSVGIAGIGKNNIDLMAINVFFGSGTSAQAFTSDILNGYNYAVKKGAQVINMSFGRLVDENFYDDVDKYQDKMLEEAINSAAAKGIVTVCASGNDNSTMKFYPADFDSCISVINIDQNNQKAFDSNYGTRKDISAYGVDIYSIIPSSQGGYKYDSGTSMASPVVAGIVALMKSKNPNATVAQIKNALYSTADDIGAKGKDSYTGYGRVNALNAVKAISGGTAITNNTTTNNTDKSNTASTTTKTMTSPTINSINSTSTYVSGTALKGVTIKVYNSNGKLIGSGKASTSTGKYSIKISKQTGGSTIKVTASKTGYNSKTATKTVLKRFTNSLTANTVYKTSTKISGKGSAYSTVKAYVNGKQIGKSATVNSSRKYTITIPKQKKGTVITLKMTKTGYVTETITKTAK